MKCDLQILNTNEYVERHQFLRRRWEKQRYPYIEIVQSRMQIVRLRTLVLLAFLFCPTLFVIFSNPELFDQGP